MIKKIYNYIIKIIGKETFWYLFFGVLTTLINFITYYIFNIALSFSAGISTTIAFIISVIFAYITNKTWVFNSKKHKIIELVKEISLFFAARIFTYFFDLILMIIFVDKLHYNSVICKLIVNILVIILNYIFSKLIVFKKGSEVNEKSNK